MKKNEKVSFDKFKASLVSVILPVTLALLIAGLGVASAFIPIDTGVGGEKVREYDSPAENKAEGFSLSGLYPWTLYDEEKSEALSSNPSYSDRNQELDSLCKSLARLIMLPWGESCDDLYIDFGSARIYETDGDGGHYTFIDSCTAVYPSMGKNASLRLALCDNTLAAFEFGDTAVRYVSTDEASAACAVLSQEAGELYGSGDMFDLMYAAGEYYFDISSEDSESAEKLLYKLLGENCSIRDFVLRLWCSAIGQSFAQLPVDTVIRLISSCRCSMEYDSGDVYMTWEDDSGTVTLKYSICEERITGMTVTAPKTYADQSYGSVVSEAEP